MFAQLPYPVYTILITFSYIIAAYFSLWGATLPGDVTPIWLPSGMALVFVLLGGMRPTLGIFLGSLLTEFSVHEFILAHIGIPLGLALGNTLEPLLIAWFIRYFAAIEESFDLFESSRNVFIFIVAILIAGLPSAFIGVTTLTLSGVAEWALYPDLWLTWWRSTCCSDILLTPLLLIWQHPIHWEKLRCLTLSEISAFIGCFIGISILVFNYSLAVEYLYLPLLIWSIFRFRRHITFSLVVIISMMAVIFTAQGHGSFSKYPINEALLLLQSFLASIALSVLFLAAMIAERKQALIALKQYNLTLEHAVAERTLALQQANDKISALNKELLDENRRMSVELAVTRQLQQMVLPKPEELKLIHNLDIAGFMESATEVGGDYYDVLQHHGRVKIGIGDVTGHGLDSGVLMLMVQTAVRTLFATNEYNSHQFLTVLNSILYANLQRMQSDKNLTLSMLDYYDGHLRISGQHEEILFVRQDGTIERIDTIELGFMLGVEPDISHFIAHRDIELHPGDGVVLYTDGLIESRNEMGDFYGVERLCTVVSQFWQCSATEVQHAIIDDLTRHLGPSKVIDDITLLVVKQKVTAH